MGTWLSSMGANLGAARSQRGATGQGGGVLPPPSLPTTYLLGSGEPQTTIVGLPRPHGASGTQMIASGTRANAAWMSG